MTEDVNDKEKERGYLDNAVHIVARVVSNNVGGGLMREQTSSLWNRQKCSVAGQGTPHILHAHTYTLLPIQRYVQIYLRIFLSCFVLHDSTQPLSEVSKPQ